MFLSVTCYLTYCNNINLFHITFLPLDSDKEEAISIQSLMKLKSRFCHVCNDVVSDDLSKSSSKVKTEESNNNLDAAEEEEPATGPVRSSYYFMLFTALLFHRNFVQVDKY